jgi:hypothetical protein
MITKSKILAFWEKSILLFLLCLVVLAAKAQKTNNDHRNFLSVSLTQLIYLDFRASYEKRISSSHGVKIEFSYKPVLSSYTDATIINFGLNATGWCYRYTAEWYYISLGYRYYFNKKKTIYCSPEIFFKTMSANNVIYSYGVGSSRTTYLTNIFEAKSMKAHVVGLNLLVGKRFRIKVSEGFHMGFDMFTGFSLRLKNIYTTIYGSVKVVRRHDSAPHPGAIPISENPLIESNNLVQASPQFGINLFFSWK